VQITKGAAPIASAINQGNEKKYILNIDMTIEEKIKYKILDVLRPLINRNKINGNNETKYIANR